MVADGRYSTQPFQSWATTPYNDKQTMFSNALHNSIHESSKKNKPWKIKHYPNVIRWTCHGRLQVATFPEWYCIPKHPDMHQELCCTSVMPSDAMQTGRNVPHSVTWQGSLHEMLHHIEHPQANSQTTSYNTRCLMGVLCAISSGM